MNKSYNGAVFFDVDGTLLDAPNDIKSITKKTKEALLLLKEAGYLCALCTGRAEYYSKVPHELFDVLITLNAAFIRVDGKVFYSKSIEKEKATRVIDFLDKNSYSYLMEGHEKFYCKDKEEYYFKRLLTFVDLPFETAGADEKIKCGEFAKLIITYKDEAAFKRLEQFLNGEFMVCKHPFNNSCDLVMNDVNKGIGVRKILEHFEISKECAYAFGDSDNDYEMFLEVSNPIVMTPSSEKARNAAKYITDSVKDEGIYNAVLKYILK